MASGCCRVIHDKRLHQWPQPRLQHGGIFDRRVLECTGQEFRAQGVLESQQLRIERPTGGQELPRRRLETLPSLDKLGFARLHPGELLHHNLARGFKLR